MYIDRDLARPRHIFAEERCGGAKCCVGNEQSDGAADGGEQEGFDEQLEWSPLAQVQSQAEVPAGQALFASLFVFENYPVNPAVGERLGELRVGGVLELA